MRCFGYLVPNRWSSLKCETEKITVKRVGAKVLTSLVSSIAIPLFTSCDMPPSSEYAIAVRTC